MLPSSKIKFKILQFVCEFAQNLLEGVTATLCKECGAPPGVAVRDFSDDSDEVVELMPIGGIDGKTAQVDDTLVKQLRPHHDPFHHAGKVAHHHPDVVTVEFGIAPANRLNRILPLVHRPRGVENSFAQVRAFDLEARSREILLDRILQILPRLRPRPEHLADKPVVSVGHLPQHGIPEPGWLRLARITKAVELDAVVDGLLKPLAYATGRLIPALQYPVDDSRDVFRGKGDIDYAQRDAIFG